MKERFFNMEIRGTATVDARELVNGFDAGGGGASACIELGEGWEARNKRRRSKGRQRFLTWHMIQVPAMLILLAIVVARALPQGAGNEEVPVVTPTLATTERVEVKETMAIIDPDMGLVDPGAVTVQTAATPEEPVDYEKVMDAIVEVMLAQGYLSDAVPLPYEYQDYMRWFSAAYGCPYPVALAAADCETDGTFDMDAVGAVGEVGIFQLNPGPEGRYHAELEQNTGMDPNTPMGNIAGGCYLLGKYIDAYDGDMDKVAMAYNMGPVGAKRAWEAGITSTEYSRKFTENVEKWEALVNAWRGI